MPATLLLDASTFARRSKASNSRARSAPVADAAAGRAVTTKSHWGASERQERRMCSRKRRRTRLRVTADPTRFPTVNPTRVASPCCRPFGPAGAIRSAYVTATYVPDTERPCCRTRTKSRAERSRWSRPNRCEPAADGPTAWARSGDSWAPSLPPTPTLGANPTGPSHSNSGPPVGVRMPLRRHLADDMTHKVRLTCLMGG
jgi:hypothetical protein